jgi:hypothetical protein
MAVIFSSKEGKLEFGSQLGALSYSTCNSNYLCTLYLTVIAVTILVTIHHVIKELLAPAD